MFESRISPPPTMPFKVHVSAFKASVDDARIIIGWTSTTYQMQAAAAAAAAAAVGGRGLNMPRGAAVKPVSRLQGTKQTHTGSRHGCHISLSSPVAPRGQREGATSPCPGRGRRGGSCSCARDNNEQHEWTHTASAAFARQRQQHNSICRRLAGGNFIRRGKEAAGLESLKTISICRIWNISIKAGAKDCDWRGAPGRENLTFPAEKQQNF